LDTKDLFVVRRPVGAFAMNQYLIACKNTREAAIVDSGEDPAVFFGDYAEKQALSTSHLIQTHGHIDHVTGLVATKNKYSNAPIYLHEKELSVYNNVEMMATMLGMHCDLPLPRVDKFVEDGQEIFVGDVKFEVILTPGHTPGHCVFYHGCAEAPFAFVGDLIFKGSVGRTDLPGCNQNHMIDSINRLAKLLPPETLLLPGHMDSTTMGMEIESNQFVRHWVKN
ncbi:unnamed protein product, partial [Ectocarpus fasciculatus]